MEKQNENKLTPILYFIGIFLLIAFIILAWISHSWLETEIASQLFAALAGAVIAAFITSILLRLQTQSQAKLIEGQATIEQEQEKESKVYEEKLRIYKEFIVKMNEIFRDKKIDEKEIIDLQFQVSYIDMHTSSEHIKTISEHVRNIVTNINNKKDEGVLLEELFAINQAFRAELYKDPDNNANTEEIDQNRRSAVDNFKSFVYGNDAYAKAIELKEKIQAQGFRQWIYDKKTLVHELYLNWNGSAFRKQPWENSLCCDSVFNDDGTISILLFLRKNTKEATEKLLQDDIWKDYRNLAVSENGRCEIKTFSKIDTDEIIISFFEKTLLPKMTEWREKHKSEYLLDNNG